MSMLRKLKEKLVGLPHHPRLAYAHKYFHEGHYMTHTVYFALACLEGHGTYAVAAGLLFVMNCIAPWISEATEA